jgi:hypothetical protein
MQIVDGKEVDVQYLREKVRRLSVQGWTSSIGWMSFIATQLRWNILPEDLPGCQIGQARSQLSLHVMVMLMVCAQLLLDYCQSKKYGSINLL